MKNPMQSAKELAEVKVKVSMEIETLRGTKSLLEDVLEGFTTAAYTVDSAETLRLNRLKFETLLKLMGISIENLDGYINKKEVNGD